MDTATTFYTPVLLVTNTRVDHTRDTVTPRLENGWLKATLLSHANRSFMVRTRFTKIIPVFPRTKFFLPMLILNFFHLLNYFASDVVIV